MRSKRLISLLVAVCMMITMLPLSAVTAFAADTSTVHEAKDGEGIYRYAYKENEDGETVTITEFLGPVDPANNGPYDIEIPTELDHHPVTGLGEYSFSGTYSPDHQTNHNLISFCNQIQSVTIPESVTSIGKSAFEHCSKLDSLTIKGVATSIGAYAFASCTSLTSLSLVGNFQTIGEQAFAYCGMTSLTTDADITSIGEYAFSHCTSLTSLSLTGDIQKIGDYAFGYCSSLYTATLSKNLTSIGTYAFEYCTSLNSIEIPGKVTEIGDYAFIDAGLTSVTIDEGVKSTGAYMFYKCGNLTTVTLPESLTTIADGSFAFCSNLDHVKIPARVTCIGDGAFSNCTSLSDITLQDGVKTIGADAFFYCRELTSITLPGSVTDIGKEAFYYCDELASITIPENVKTINPDTFYWCSSLKDITLPAGLTSFQDELTRCPAGRFYATDYKKDENDKPILNPDGSYIYIYTPDGAIYFNNDRDHADNLLKNPVLAGRNFLCLCHVTFDAKGGKTDYDKVPVYETEKITDTKANELKATDLDAINHPTRTGYKFTGWYTDNDQLFDVKETAITEDTTLYAGWEFDPDALDCHQLTVTGGTVTVKYDGSDVTSKLNSRTDATTGKKTYYVPDGATVTVTLDKTAVPNGKVFDGWSTSLPTGQDYKAESITFRMSSGVDIAAQYRDAAADHTHDTDTAVCHPLTVTGGIVTVKKGDKDVTDTLTVTTDEATGKKTYSVPEGATVTVTLDKTLIPEGMVFDIWSTGKFSLPLGQDYKAESITFTMNTMSSDVVDIAAQYRDATIEDDGPNVLGTAAIIGTAAVGTAVLGYQAYSLGAEFAGKLMALPYFPSNRSALAMMLWEDAGKPMPESELLYPDVEQEEQDMDLQHAARWAMENELIPDLNDEGTAPEEMKFFPANPVSKLDVLNAWQKAQELKNN